MSIQDVSVARMEGFPEYDGHARVVQVMDQQSGLRGYIAIHREKQYVPALGATRVWAYTSEDEALRDALRLSRLMSYKSVMSGLPYTGGKAVLYAPEQNTDRKEFFRAYGRAIEALEGTFVTGTDVGMTNEDLSFIQEETSYVIGTNVDSGYYTAQGVLRSIDTAISHLSAEHQSSISCTIQGLGKTGGKLCDLLSKRGISVYVNDIDEQKVQAYTQRYATVRPIDSEALFSTSTTIFSPCAMNGVLQPASIAPLSCRIVAGAANNQLADSLCGTLLLDRGIVYIPDYIANAGGLISVVDEYEHGYMNEERIFATLDAIQIQLNNILTQSTEQHIATNSIADTVAEQMIVRW